MLADKKKEGSAFCISFLIIKLYKNNPPIREKKVHNNSSYSFLNACLMPARKEVPSRFLNHEVQTPHPFPPSLISTQLASFPNLASSPRGAQWRGANFLLLPDPRTLARQASVPASSRRN